VALSATSLPVVVTADELREPVGVARRHLVELVAERHRDGARVHVRPEDVEPPALRGADERELREAAAHDHHAPHCAGSFSSAWAAGADAGAGADSGADAGVDAGFGTSDVR
jgi:hypothetical protein